MIFLLRGLFVKTECKKILWKIVFLTILKIKNDMNKIFFPLAIFLLFGFPFTECQLAFCQISNINENVNLNLTAKQALKKNFKSCKVTYTVKNGLKTSNIKNKTFTNEPLDTLGNPYLALIKLGLNNKIVNNKTPRDSFLNLYSNAQKINDTMYYLYQLPPPDTSSLHLPNMGSHPWLAPPAITFDASGIIKSIVSGGGGGSECCAGGDRWSQTISFKGNISYTSTTHTQQPGEEIETEWDPTHSYPVTVTKNKNNSDTYSKITYTYFFKKGILYKMTEVEENKAFSENKTILYKFHYKK